MNNPLMALTIGNYKVHIERYLPRRGTCNKNDVTFSAKLPKKTYKFVDYGGGGSVAHQQDPASAHFNLKPGLSFAANRDYFKPATPKGSFSSGQYFPVWAE